MRKSGIAVKLWSDDSGATAVEYGIMVALIAVVIIVAVSGVGTKLKLMFENVDLHTAITP
jgi:pilus assembly protein Flp/PilA